MLIERTYIPIVDLNPYRPGPDSDIISDHAVFILDAILKQG